MNFQNQADYLKQLNNEDILSGVFVPAPLQEETLKSQIMFRCGLLDPAYTEPEIMQAAIAQFFKREQWNITHLVNIILAEYSPIENTDRYSEKETKQNGTRKVTTGGTDTHSGTDERDLTNSGMDQTDTRHTGDDITTNTVSAFNSSTYQPDSQSDLQYGHIENEAFIHGHRVDDDLKYGHKIDRTGHTDEETTGGDKYVEHTHGNIGVTTNQEMIEQELQLLRHFDVYDWIAAKLENELFVQVY